MKTHTLLILLLTSFCLFTPTDSFAARVGRVSGKIFNDSDGDNALSRLERGGAPAIIWLYRVLPNGAVQRVRQVYTDTRGSYAIGKVRYGTYFISVHYLSGDGTPIRTGNFQVKAATVRRNVPIITSETLVSNSVYAAAFTSTSTPDRLTKGPDDPTTPYTP